MTREELEAALAWEWEFVRDVQNSNPNSQIAKAGVDMVHTAFAAARMQLALMAEKCERCDGNGLIDFERDEYGQQIGPQEEFCPTCLGSGKVYPQETVETIAEALASNLFEDWDGLSESLKDDYRSQAVAVLDALGEIPA